MFLEFSGDATGSLAESTGSEKGLLQRRPGRWRVYTKDGPVVFAEILSLKRENARRREVFDRAREWMKT